MYTAAVSATRKSKEVNPVRNIKYTHRKKISNGVKIIIKNFQKKIPVNPKRIKKAILNVFSSEGVNKSGEISVCFVDDSKIRRLNKKYAGKNNPTDVLAFDIAGSGISKRLFADIVVSAQTAMRNSKIFKTTPDYELSLYVVHGALHLLGFNDHTAHQSKIMRGKERKYTEWLYKKQKG